MAPLAIPVVPPVYCNTAKSSGVRATARNGWAGFAKVVRKLTWCLNENGGTIFLMCLTAKRSEEHTSELQSRGHLVCRLLLEKKKKKQHKTTIEIKTLFN